MSIKNLFRVAGVDGCKAGWLVAIISVTKKGKRTDTSCVYDLKCILVASTFAEVLSKTADCELVCVDIPIGLSDRKRRECDLAARKVLGGQRASSVFPAPIRLCLLAKDYKTACEISFEHSDRKLSWQSFFLLDKIRQVDDLMSPVLQQRIREIHPELSFWALKNKKPTRYKKTRLVGRKERMKLLAPIFSELERIVAEARKPKEVAPDDILDALVAAWTAGQVVLGKAETLPENPELDSKGLRMEILCPVAPRREPKLDGYWTN
jgi:predicted RNase H-like nuclease